MREYYTSQGGHFVEFLVLSERDTEIGRTVPISSLRKIMCGPTCS